MAEITTVDFKDINPKHAISAWVAALESIQASAEKFQGCDWLNELLDALHNMIYDLKNVKEKDK